MLTIIVPTKNDLKNIKNNFNNFPEKFQVIFVDSNSEDQTKEFVKLSGYEYVTFNWNGKYPKKRNWALKNCKIDNEWVLFLDTDEYLSSEAIAEIEEKIQCSEKEAYWIEYQNYFLGQKLKYGIHQRKLALFKKDYRYERIEENSWSNFDMEIHEHPIIDGPIGILKTKLEHYDFNNISEHYRKHIEYAKWEAQRYSSIIDKEKLTFRQKIKYRMLSHWYFASLYFLYHYIIKFGFMDGVVGYRYAYSKYWYFRLVRSIIRELKSV